MKAKAAVRPKVTLGHWISMIVLAGAVLATAQKVNWQAHANRQLLTELGQLRVQKNQTRAEWGRLLLEQGAHTSYARIEEEAAQQLAMHVPDPREIRMLPQ